MKITFSTDEIELLQRSDFFMTKHNAIEKVMQLFAELKDEYSSHMSTLPDMLHSDQISEGRIFRGDNYRKLPYVVLDYPKHFNADSIFTFRTMFWWGKEFSFTLHLFGHALDHYKENIQRNIHQLAGKDFYFCVNTKQWEYHFEPSNYIPLDEFLKKQPEGIQGRTFIKLSRRLDVGDYEKVVKYGKESFEEVMGVLSQGAKVDT